MAEFTSILEKKQLKQFKNLQVDMVVHTVILAVWEADAGGLQV